MDKYLNREHAGQILANELTPYANRSDILVLALPRGGVPVAYEIAKTLHAPLDIFVVRKLGVPGYEELAMGAIAMGGISVLNESIVQDLRISQETIHLVSQKEEKELERRIKSYRGDQPLPTIKDKIIILVDDGIATGASMRVAINALRRLKPAQIIMAVPVAEHSTCEKLSQLVDKTICPLRPTHFYAVGAWYEQFGQTTDEEVRELLSKAKLFLITSKGDSI